MSGAWRVGGRVMNAVLEIQKTSEGKIQARRLDGKPLTPADRDEVRRRAVVETVPVATQGQATTRPIDLTAQEWIDIDNGKISAVLIDSEIGPLWFAFADDFLSGDVIPVFFASELPFLGKMTRGELCLRYAQKK